jgi:hypothetical protein
MIYLEKIVVTRYGEDGADLSRKWLGNHRGLTTAPTGFVGSPVRASGEDPPEREGPRSHDRAYKNMRAAHGNPYRAPPSYVCPPPEAKLEIR